MKFYMEKRAKTFPVMCKPMGASVIDSIEIEQRPDDFVVRYKAEGVEYAI